MKIVCELFHVYSDLESIRRIRELHYYDHHEQRKGNCFSLEIPW